MYFILNSNNEMIKEKLFACPNKLMYNYFKIICVSNKTY